MDTSNALVEGISTLSISSPLSKEDYEKKIRSSLKDLQKEYFTFYQENKPRRDEEEDDKVWIFRKTFDEFASSTRDNSVEESRNLLKVCTGITLLNPRFFSLYCQW